MKIKTCGIYKITSPSGKIYIGQSRDILARFKIYEKNDCKNQRKLKFSLEKHGYENHTFEIIEECSKELLNEREIYYIKFYDTFDTKHGMNLTSGGSNPAVSDETKKLLSLATKGKPKIMSKEHIAENTRRILEENKKRIGTKHSEESKKKISQSHLGKKKSEEHRKSISKAKIGKPVSFSQDHRNNRSKFISELNKSRAGKPLPEETKNKIRETTLGRVLSEEHRANLRKANQTRIRTKDEIQRMIETRKRNKELKD